MAKMEFLWIVHTTTLDGLHRQTKEKRTMKKTKRKKSFVSGVRPSQARNTEIVSGACEVCGSDEWDTDVVRGRRDARGSFRIRRSLSV